MRKMLILILFTFLIACGSTVKLATPRQSDVDRVISKYPGYNLEELNNGKALFQQNCNKCHALKNPVSKNENQWNEIVPKMVKRLNAKEGKTVIDENQQQSILRYLVTMSSASK